MNPYTDSPPATTQIPASPPMPQGLTPAPLNPKDMSGGVKR